MAKHKDFKDINLLLSYYRKPKKLQTKKPSGMKFLFPMLILAILIYSLLNFHNKTNKLEKEIALQQSYIDSPENKEKYELSSELLTKFSDKNMLYSLISSENLAITKIKIKYISDIYNSMNENIFMKDISYLNKDATISINFVSNSEFEINEFVKRLKKTGDFAYVGYKGYDFMGDKNQYLFNVQCGLK